MTDETRETLTIHADCVEDELDGQAAHGFTEARVHVDRDVLAALRDVLTPRTCGTCRHSVEHRRWNDGGVFLTCEHLGSLACCNKVRPDDGCIRGWQAREGEGGTR